MSEINFEAIKQNVLRRLEQGLPGGLYYHGIHHTRDDVLPASIRLAKLANLSDEDTLLLKTAALYHDIGYIENPKNHEAIGARIAASELSELGYTPLQVQKIVNMIMATRMPQSPKGLLEQLMCDSDLDSLGREDFFVTSHSLRLELKEMGIETRLKEWYTRQLKFLESQEYWTEFARKLRNPGKEQTITELRNVLSIAPDDA